ncbi:MAG: phosphate/phosphite/phosphonate ABC transporter substrate-binding protein [Gammaproteobacteria bacterium]
MSALHFHARLAGALCGLLVAQAALAEANTPSTGQRTKVAYAPQERVIGETPTTEAGKALVPKSTDLIFSAPPRGAYAEEVAIYQPIVEYLSRVTGQKFRYQYSDNWLTYSKDMTSGAYDLVFDGPAFNGWRMTRMQHTPLIKLPEEFVFVVVTRKDNTQVTELKQLAGRKICAHAPPNLGTLTMLSQFDNPARQPSILETKGWDAAYRAVAEGKCAGTVLPQQSLVKNDKDKNQMRVIYKHRPMPNQAFSAGPRISPAMQQKIKAALMSEEGRAVTAKLRALYAGKDFVAATPEEYAGLGQLLKDSLYYY